MISRTAVLLVLKFLISVGLLYLVLSYVNLLDILEQLAGADLFLVFIAYVIASIGIALSAWRWHLLAPNLLSIGTALKYSWIGFFYSMVLPGAISGDVAKGISLAVKDRETRGALLPASIIADRVIGLVVLLVFFDVACAIIYFLYGEAFGPLRYLAGAAIVLSILGVGGGVLTVWWLAQASAQASRKEGWISHALQRLQDAASTYLERPRQIAIAAALSVAVHSANLFAYYFTLLSLDIKAGILFAAVIYPILGVIHLIPISVSGLGVREVTLVALFQSFGLSPVAAVALSWIALLAAVPTIIIGAALQLAEIYRRRDA